MCYVWQGVANNAGSFLLSAGQRLKDIYSPKWSLQGLRVEKMYHYTLFKTHISPEYIVFGINSKRFRMASAQSLTYL